MTARELMVTVGGQPLWLLIAVLLVPPVASFILSLLHEPEDSLDSPQKYLYSLIIFAVFIPGIFGAVVVGYSLFFQAAENLLDMNLFAIGGPILSMILTVQIMKWRNIDIEGLPGFGRLLGLIIMIAVSSAIALFVHKADFRIWFLGGVSSLFWTGVGLLVLFLIGYHFLFGR